MLIHDLPAVTEKLLSIPGVRPIGGFFPISEERSILNPCKMSLIDQTWQSALEEVRDAVVSNAKEALLSLYIRGSVPRGLAIDGVSDLDLICITKRPTDRTAFLTDTVANSILAAHPCTTGLELETYTTAEANDLKGVIPFLLKCHSLLLWGEPLADRLPEFYLGGTSGIQPGIRILPGTNINLGGTSMINLNLGGTSMINLGGTSMIHLPWLHKDLSRFRIFLRGEPSQMDRQRAVRWFAKRTVRSAFEMVMGEAGTYTRDLLPCAAVFLQFRPSRFDSIALALELSLSPSQPDQSRVSSLTDFATWLVNANK